MNIIKAIRDYFGLGPTWKEQAERALAELVAVSAQKDRLASAAASAEKRASDASRRLEDMARAYGEYLSPGQFHEALSRYATNPRAAEEYYRNLICELEESLGALSQIPRLVLKNEDRKVSSKVEDHPARNLMLHILRVGDQHITMSVDPREYLGVPAVAAHLSAQLNRIFDTQVVPNLRAQAHASLAKVLKA